MVQNAVSGFRITAIKSYNPKVFINADFVPSETSERETEFDSEKSAK